MKEKTIDALAELFMLIYFIVFCLSVFKCGFIVGLALAIALTLITLVGVGILCGVCWIFKHVDFIGGLAYILTIF
jgi:hypothetical protein